LKVAITEMYPRFACEPVADPLGSTEHTLETADIKPSLKIRVSSVGSDAHGFVDFKFHRCL